MSVVVEKPALNGVNTPTLLATINTVGAQPELAARNGDAFTRRHPRGRYEFGPAAANG